MRLKHIILWGVFFVMSASLGWANKEYPPTPPLTEEAQEMFRQLEPSVVEVRVVDLATGKRVSYGTGFVVAEQGWLATNFHVISALIQYPETHRLEWFRSKEDHGTLEIVAIDVVHDLALVRSDKIIGTPLALDVDWGEKGARIFSMGNPRDLGMSIIEGNINGLLERSPYERLLFSGALNPGMSGGPALNRRGDVIGVNVSTAGSDLSFLVPSSDLARLIAKAKEAEANGAASASDFHAEIEQQLFNNQSSYIERLQTADWESIQLGHFSVPGDILPLVKCNGQSANKLDRKYEYARSGCGMADRIYLSSSLTTGMLGYSFFWYQSDQLNPVQFYTLIDDAWSGRPSNWVTREDVTDFRCNTRFVSQQGAVWKTSFCSRQYIRYAGLFDFHYSAVSVNQPLEALVVKLDASGLSMESGLSLINKFMGALRWTD